MPRLESLAKAGYYPTPGPVVQQIREVLRVAWVSGRLREKFVYRILDPCCGTGEAVQRVADKFKDNSAMIPVETFGIELSQERASEARENLNYVLNADLFHCSVAHNSISLLYLNPPYDDEVQAGTGPKRTELAFLQRATPYLIPAQGLLVYIIPKRILEGEAICRFLSAHYANLKCWDFPEDERERFGQVVIIGVRRSDPRPPVDENRIRAWATNPPAFHRAINRYDPRYELHVGDVGRILFNNLYLDPQAIAEEAAVKGLWVNPTMRQALWPENDDLKRPLMPLRQGHVAMLTAAGFLDNMMLERDGQRILVKGRTYKEFEIIEETEEKIVQQERMRTTIVSLDLDTGIFTDIRA